MSEELIFKTYEQWNKEGYYVRKGEKSPMNNIFNTPLFSHEQVERKESEAYYDAMDEDYDDPLNYDPWMFS